MEKRLWFKAKNYGWGWYPATWQGWAVTFGYIALFFPAIFWFESDPEKIPQRIVPFLVYVVLLTALLIWTCYKTGEKPEWRWGK